MIYEKRMPGKLKVKMHEALLQPVLLYGVELRTLRKKEEKMLTTTEMKIL